MLLYKNLTNLFLPSPKRVLSLEGWFPALRVHQELVKQFMLKYNKTIKDNFEGAAVKLQAANRGRHQLRNLEKQRSEEKTKSKTFIFYIMSCSKKHLHKQNENINYFLLL